jgi:hypothetical protein
MTRDWHATYLTDPRAMAAARDRVTATGEDGWAAAYTLALTLPPASGCYDAVGARDVLVPDTLPDADELARLERATPNEGGGGYYGEPNISFDNPDMAHSMVRRALPHEKIRPDLRCPKCCQAAGDADEAGMPGQVYRCTDCPESWEYRAPADQDEELHEWVAVLPMVPDEVRENMIAFQERWAPRGLTVRWSIPDAAPSASEDVSPGHWYAAWTDGEAIAFIPEEMPHGGDPSVGETVRDMLMPAVWAWPEEPETPEHAAERVAREASELRDALEFASRNPTTDQAMRRSGMVEARRRGYIRELIPGRRRAGQTRRVGLTGFGRAVLMRLRRATNSR